MLQELSPNAGLGLTEAVTQQPPVAGLLPPDGHADVVGPKPIVGVPEVHRHLVLFFSMAWPIALASVLLAVVISFPLAYLFELGGDTIWAPAILHFVVQATVKVAVFPHGAASFALAWMSVSAMVPLLVFTVKAPTRR